MFAGEQQWHRAGHKQELCRPGFCAQHCTGVSRHLVIWCCEYKPSIETFFHFKAPRGFSGHWLNGSRGRGAQGEQVQSISGVIPAAICFLFRGLGSLNALWHASWRHTPLAAAAACPVTMAPWFRLTPHMCRVNRGGLLLLWVSKGRATGVEEGEGDGELHR